MNLIIDGNAFINVAISVTKSVTSKDKSIGELYYVEDLFNDGFRLKEAVRLSFRNFCFTYLNSLISSTSTPPSKVHIVFDSPSWRKEYTNDFFKDSDFKTTSAPQEFKYKGTRRYDEFQYLFFDYFQQVIMPHLVEKCGVNQYRLKGTEGDDIIAHLCEIVNDDILIYSVDQDLKQLTGTPQKNVLLIVPKQMAKHKRLFVPAQLVPQAAETEEDNFFSLNMDHISGSSIEKVISTLKNKEYMEHKVDLINEVLTKVFLGDKSDNIPRITNITPSRSQKLISSLCEKFGDTIISNLDSLNNEFINEVTDQIHLVTKAKDSDKLDEIREHLVFNIRLTRLSTKVFPDEIRNVLEEFFSSHSVTLFNSKEFTNLKNNLSTI
jgi:5'-3' exonuclease